MTMVDLHIHPGLPWIGAAWRVRGQGFRIESLDGGVLPAPDPPPFRIYGAAFYETYLLRPAPACRRLFRSLESFRLRVEASGGRRILLRASDLERSDSIKSDLSGAREFFFLAVESLRCLRGPGDVQRLWDLGVRSLQPIHFLDTSFGGSSREGLLPPSRKGVTGFGRETLAEMARLGLILDIAHMGAKTAEDCLAIYPGPVMCSHTGLYGLKASSRNLTADLAREIFRRQGIVGVTCWRHLLGSPPGPAEGEYSRRASWTRAYCATVAAFAALASDARVAVGSDRGAPIRAPAWFYSPGHLREMETCLGGFGWGPERTDRFFRGHALDFLSRSLPRS